MERGDEDEGEELVALARRYAAFTPEDRAREAARRDLSELEQTALAAFADDIRVADALVTNPTASDTVQYLAKLNRRRSLPLWKRFLQR